MYEFVAAPWSGSPSSVSLADWAINSSRWRCWRVKQGSLPDLRRRFGARSLFHWVLPFGGRQMRLHPLYTLLSYAFHICVLVTPLFLMGHAVLWQESWGFRWWSLAEGVAMS